MTSGTLVSATMERAVATAPSASVRPGPEHDRVVLARHLHELARSRRGERLRLALRQPHHRHREQVRVRGRDDRLRDRERDVARARAHRAAGREHGRARVGARAGDHEHPAARVLVRVGGGQRQERRVLIGGPDLGGGRDVGEARLDADVGHDDLAREPGAGVDEQPPLGCGECDGAVGLDHGADGRARVGVDSGGSVDREQVRAARIRGFDPRRERFAQRAGGPDAEQGVDDAGCIAERLGRRRLRRRAPRHACGDRIARRLRCDARELVRSAHGEHARRPPARVELASGHPPVAAVVAGPGEHDDVALGHPLGDLAGHGGPGGLHQGREREALLGDGELFDGSSLGGGEYAVHRSPSLT